MWSGGDLVLVLILLDSGVFSGGFSILPYMGRLFLSPFGAAPSAGALSFLVVFSGYHVPVFRLP